MDVQDIISKLSWACDQVVDAFRALFQRVSALVGPYFSKEAIKEPSSYIYYNRVIEKEFFVVFSKENATLQSKKCEKLMEVQFLLQCISKVVDENKIQKVVLPMFKERNEWILFKESMGDKGVEVVDHADGTSALIVQFVETVQLPPKEDSKKIAI